MAQFQSGKRYHNGYRYSYYNIVYLENLRLTNLNAVIIDPFKIDK